MNEEANQKNRSLLIIALIILVAVVVLIVRAVDKPKPKPVDLTKTQPGYSIIKACNLITPKVADNFLGANATPASSNTAADATTDIYVSICAYSSDGSSTASGIESISVLTRSAKDKKGAKSNLATIKTDEKSKNFEAVSIEGQTAYWEQKTGELTLYKDDDLILLGVSGSNTSPADNSLTDAEDVANYLNLYPATVKSL